MSTAAKEDRTAKVIPFPERGFSRKKIMEDDQRQQCLEALRALGPMDESLVQMMEIPTQLFARGTETGSSFSSEKDRGIEKVPDLLYLQMDLPKDLPEYGILISSRNSSIFCTLLDSKRKILVSESVRNLHGGDGDWSSFKASLHSALARSKAMQSDGQVFRFVVESEGSTTV